MLTARDLDETLAQEWGAPGSPERQAKVAEAWEQADVLGSAWTGAKSSATIGAATLVAQKAAAFTLLKLGLSQGAKIAGYGAAQSLWGKTLGGEGISTHEWAGWDGGYGAWADNLALIGDVLAFLGELVGTIGLVAGVLAGVGLLAVVPGLQFLAALIPPSLTVLKVTTVAGLVIGILQIAARVAATGCRREHLLTMELTDQDSLVAQQHLLSTGVTELAGAAGGAAGGTAANLGGALTTRAVRAGGARWSQYQAKRRAAQPPTPEMITATRPLPSAEHRARLRDVDEALLGHRKPAPAPEGTASPGTQTAQRDSEPIAGNERRAAQRAREAEARQRRRVSETERARDSAIADYERQRLQNTSNRITDDSVDVRLRAARAREQHALERLRREEAGVVATRRRLDEAQRDFDFELEVESAFDQITGAEQQGRPRTGLERSRRQLEQLKDRFQRQVETAEQARDRHHLAAGCTGDVLRESASLVAERSAFQNVQRTHLAYEMERNLLHTLEGYSTDSTRDVLARYLRATPARLVRTEEIAGPTVGGATGGGDAALKEREKTDTRTEPAPTPNLPPAVTSAGIDRLAVDTAGADALARESSADAADAAAARAQSSAEAARLTDVAAGLDVAASDSERLDGALTHKGEIRSELDAQHEETAAKVKEPAGRFSVLDSLVSLVQDLLGFGSRLNNPDLPERVQAAGRSLGETSTGIEESWGTTRTAFTGYDTVGSRQKSANEAGRERLEQSRDTVPQTRAGLAESQARVGAMITETTAATESADAAHAQATTTAAAATALAAATHARHEAAVAEYDAWGLTHEAARQEATEARVRNLEESGFDVTTAGG